jgi:hypothetical protein
MDVSISKRELHTPGRSAFPKGLRASGFQLVSKERLVVRLTMVGPAGTVISTRPEKNGHGSKARRLDCGQEPC